MDAPYSLVAVYSASDASKVPLATESTAIPGTPGEPATVLPSIVYTSKSKKWKVHKKVLDVHNTSENGVWVSHTSTAKSTVETKKQSIYKKCPHDRRPAQCRDCKGKSFCEHNKQQANCNDCRGSSFCEHNKRKMQGL